MHAGASPRRLSPVRLLAVLEVEEVVAPALPCLGGAGQVKRRAASDSFGDRRGTPESITVWKRLARST